MSAVASESSPPPNRALKIIAVLGGLAVFLIVGLLLWAFSKVHGTEFSPTHFQSRTFAFREIPFLGIQVTGITRSSSTGSTAMYLAANKLIQVPVTAPRRWDLIQINRSMYPADAEILTRFIDGYSRSNVDWEKWSKDHPKAAAVFWPIIQQMAIDRLYLMMPRAFELAENETDPTILQQDLDSYLVNELPAMAEDLANAGQRDLAINALKSAIVRYPKQPELGATLSDLQ